MSVSLRARAALVLAVCCVGLAPTSGPYRPRPSPSPRLELYFTRVKKQGPIDRPGCPRAATSRPLPTGSLPGRGLGSAVRHPACCFEWLEWLGAHSSRYARPSSCVPATHGPSNPDFHSCRPPPPRAALVWSRARVRDNSFTSGRPWSSPQTA